MAAKETSNYRLDVLDVFNVFDVCAAPFSKYMQTIPNYIYKYNIELNSFICMLLNELTLTYGMVCLIYIPTHIVVCLI